MAISSIEAQEVEYVPSSKGRKCQYLGPWAMNQKTKDTLLSQTLKGEKKKRKCPYFFYLWPRSRDMAISSLEAQEVEYVPSSKGENANILAPGL